MCALPLKRMTKELQTLRLPEGAAHAPDAADPLLKHVFGFPVRGTPASGTDPGRVYGWVHLQVTVPPDYPFVGPEVQVLHAAGCPHPNVSPTGALCLPLLQKAVWALSNTIQDVVLEVHRVLQCPNFSTPLNDVCTGPDTTPAQFWPVWCEWAARCLPQCPPPGAPCADPALPVPPQ